MNRLFIRHEGVFLLISAVLLFLLFTPMFMVTGIVWSQTLSNDIEQPVEKWTRAQSPILIQGVKTVPKKNVLIIEPGVVIAFEKGASLEVYGTLIASGMDDDNNQIIFTSNKDLEFAENLYSDIRDLEAFKENKDEWLKISFHNDEANQPSILENCVIRYSKDVIECADAYPILQHILLERNIMQKIRLNGVWTQVTRGYNSFPVRSTSLQCEIHTPDSVYNNHPFKVTIYAKNNSDKEVQSISPYLLTLIGSGLLEWDFDDGKKGISLLPWDLVKGKKIIPLLPGERQELILNCTIRGARSGNQQLKTFVVGEESISDVLISSAATISDTFFFNTAPPPRLVSPAAVKIPEAPSNLRIVERIEGGIVIAWDDESDNESGFILELKRGLQEAWATGATIEAGVNTFQILGIESDKPVSFRLKAFNEAGESQYSNVLGISPAEAPVETPEETPDIALEEKPEEITVSRDEEVVRKPFYTKTWFIAAGATGLAIITYGLLRPSSETTPAADLPGPPNLPD